MYAWSIIMSKLNKSILVQNIDTILKNKKLTQQTLGEILGMSQPNVSKALNPNEKKCFTLEQIVDIADYFHVSVDYLIGNSQAISASHSPREIGEFISDLLASKDGKVANITVEEWVSEVDPATGYSKQETRQVHYPAVYFPDHWIPETDDEAAEASRVGNETSMIPVNQFLHSFLEILNTYHQGLLSQETYEMVVTNLLENLRN